MEQRHHKFILFFALILVLVVRCLYAILRLIVPSNEFQDVPAYSQPYLYQVVVTIFAIATTLRFAYQLRNARWNARLVATDEKVAVWSQLWFATLVVFYTEGTFTTATIGLLALFPILGSHFSAPNAAIAVTSIISSIIVLLVDLNAFYDVRVAVVQDEEIPLLHRFIGFCVTLLTIWMCTLRFEALIQVEQRRFNSVTDFVVDLLDQIASFDMEGLTELLSANAGKEFITAELDYVARACLKNMSHLRPYLPANLIPNEQKELDPDDLAMAQDAGDDDEPGDLNDYVGQGKSYAAEEDSTQLATVLRLRSCTILAIECTTQRKASAADIAARSHQFLTVVLEQISRNDGVVNTMTPFAVVASFNGQSPCQRHAKRASSAALGIVSKLKNVVLDPPLEAFIAIDTRENIAGVCGVDRQLARVVAGEGVLLAQRLVGLARYLRTPIIISHEAAMEVNSQFSTVPIDVVCPTWPYGYSGEGPAATTDLVVYELRSRRIDNSLEAYIAAFHEFRGGRIAGALGNLSLYSELRKDEREFHARRLESICRAMAADQTIRPTMVRQDIGWERFRGEADVLSAESARPRLQEPADDATHVGTREPEEMNFRETIAELQPAPETKGEEKTDGLIDMFVFGSPSDDEGDTPAPVAEAGGQNESGGVEEQLPRTFEDDVHMEKWLLSQKCLGSGSFSAVHLGMSVEGLLVAMKVFSLRAKQTNTRLLGEEVERMRRLSHHNIVSYISCALRKNSGHFIIVMEYVSGGSLKNILETFGPPPLTAIRKYVTDLLRGLKYLHENGIIHCDVKPHNALLTSDGSCKLSDFGSAVNVTLYKGEAGAGGAAAEDVMVRGTSYYLAPEACRNEITSAVDIWSVGITVLELMTGRLPWDFKGGEAAFIRELGKNPNFMPVIPGDIPANAASFCKRCLNRSPEQRPTADELLRSPFLGS